MKRNVLRLACLLILACLYLAGQYFPPGGGASVDTNGLVWLETETLSSSATADFACPSSTYDVFVFKFVNVVPATDGTNLRMQVFTDGGTTPVSTSVYTNSNTVTRAGAVVAGGTETPGASIDLSAWNIDNTAAEGGLSGSFEFYNPAGASHWKTISGDSNFRDSAQFRLKVYVVGRYEETTAVTDVRFFMASGNMATGTIYCYGISKN